MGTLFDLNFQTFTSSEYSEICGRPINLEVLQTYFLKAEKWQKNNLL
jgi:hypothetical protein